jgi:hypothetical protein
MDITTDGGVGHLLLDRRCVMKLKLAFALFGIFAAAAPSFAHEGGKHIKGTVKTISAEKLTIETGSGTEAVALSPETSFLRNSVPATALDVRPGDRVVVHARKLQNGLEAVEVRAASVQRPKI